MSGRVATIRRNVSCRYRNYSIKRRFDSKNFRVIHAKWRPGFISFTEITVIIVVRSFVRRRD